MSWMILIAVYLTLMVVLAILGRRLFEHQLPILVRTLVAGTLLLMLGELIAEERALWTIPSASGFYILKAPAEGALLVVATLLNSLLPYLWFRRARSREAE